MLRALQQQLIFQGSRRNRRSVNLARTIEWGNLYNLTSPHLDRVVVGTNFGAPISSMKYDDPSMRLPMMFFYGNAGSLDQSEFEFNLLRECGCDVWIPDYVGYGRSTGESSEEACQFTADTLYDHLVRDLGSPPCNIIVVGHSLGAAVALDLAVRRTVGAVVAICPFTSIAEMAAHSLPFGSRLAGIISQRFDSAAKIAKVTCPILITHGTNDRIVPFDMGLRLASIAPTEHVRFVSIPNAGHNDIMQVGASLLLTEIGNIVSLVSTSRGGVG